MGNKCIVRVDGHCQDRVDGNDKKTMMIRRMGFNYITERQEGMGVGYYDVDNVLCVLQDV